MPGGVNSTLGTIVKAASRFGRVTHDHESHRFQGDGVVRSLQMDGKLHEPEVAVLLMAHCGKRGRLAFDGTEAPDGRMVPPGGLAAEREQVVHGKRRDAAIVRGRRSQKKIALGRHSLM